MSVLHLLLLKRRGGGDVTPDAISLSAIGWQFVPGNGTITSAQITGINDTITLKIEIAYESGASAVQIWRKVQNTSFGGDIQEEPTVEGFTQVLHNGTFAVSPNQYVAFACTGEETYDPAGTVTVKNASDGDATLASFSFKVKDFI